MTQKVVIREKYRNLYESDNPSTMEWRTIGAKDKVNNIINLVDFSKGKNKILEIGCGDGAILNELSNLIPEVELYGLEIAESLVNVVNRRKIQNLKECKHFDGYNIPYDNNLFDLVIMSHVIEHVEHPRILIHEASKVSSKIVFEVPLEHTIRLKKNFVLTPTGHLNYYTYKTFRILLQSCDLKIINEKISNSSIEVYKFKGGLINLVKFSFRELLLKIFGRFAAYYLTYHYTVHCRCPKLPV